MPKLSLDKEWGSLNKKLDKAMQESDFFNMGTIYYEMADFLKKEGKDDGEMRKLGYSMKSRAQDDGLSRYLQSENEGILSGVEVLASKDSCNACKKMNGKIFPAKEAMISRPIPIEECSHEYGCRCTYMPVVKRD